MIRPSLRRYELDALDSSRRSSPSLTPMSTMGKLESRQAGVAAAVLIEAFGWQLARQEAVARTRRADLIHFS
jgi:hypothetical protein